MSGHKARAFARADRNEGGARCGVRTPVESTGLCTPEFGEVYPEESRRARHQRSWAVGCVALLGLFCMGAELRAGPDSIGGGSLPSQISNLKSPGAGAPLTPAQLLLDSLDTPRAGAPLTLHVTVISRVQAPAKFELRLSAPGGIELGGVELSGIGFRESEISNLKSQISDWRWERVRLDSLGADAAYLSGALAGGERRTMAVVVTPKQLGDFRVAARLAFLPDGAERAFLVDNSAVLRVRANEHRSDVFVEQKEWPRKYLADEIKAAKAALRHATQDERDLRIRQLTTASPTPSGFQAQSRLEAGGTGSAAIPGGSVEEPAGSWPDSTTAGKQPGRDSEWAGHLGSVERHPADPSGMPTPHANADGLVRRGVPVSVVYRREFSLRVGQRYLFETRHLTAGGDPVAYLFASDAATGQLALVARNDDADATTLGSRLAYTPDRDGAYLLVARSATPETRGAAGIYLNGEFIERVSFAGIAFRLTADAGDALRTVALGRAPNRADTLLFVTPASVPAGVAEGPDGIGAVRPAALWDDDGGMELGSQLVLPHLRDAEVVLGADSTASEGRADLILNTADGTFGAHPRGDLDGDGLSNELERALGTDPAAQDTDRDGLLDSWEALGVRDTDFPALGADGTFSDVFVQVDWMASTHDHHPHPDGMQMIMDSFAATGMNLHVDDGRPEEGELGHLLPDPWTHLDFLALGSATFREIKAANFDSAKRGGLYRYNIFAHRQPGSCSSGAAFIRAFDSLVTLGCAIGQIGSITEQAGTFMHELGHNLGLRHGGFQDLNYKPNYRSVMTYLFQFPGTCGRVDFNNGVIFFRCNPREFFYSFGAGPELDENCLDENVGVGEDPIDWSQDGQLDSCVAVDVNYPRGGRADGRFNVLSDNDDYADLFIPGAGFADEIKPLEEEIIICPPPPPEPPL